MDTVGTVGIDHIDAAIDQGMAKLGLIVGHHTTGSEPLMDASSAASVTAWRRE